MIVIEDSYQNFLKERSGVLVLFLWFIHITNRIFYDIFGTGVAREFKFLKSD